MANGWRMGGGWMAVASLDVTESDIAEKTTLSDVGSAPGI